MRAFELAVHPDKTRLIHFGRHAAKQREERGESKPETFDFLGFTHFCTRSRNRRSFVIGRKTIKKRMVRQLQAIKMELRRRMHDPIAKTGAWMEWWFVVEVRWRWLKTLKRRSQRAFLHWDELTSMTAVSTRPTVENGERLIRAPRFMSPHPRQRAFSSDR